MGSQPVQNSTRIKCSQTTTSTVEDFLERPPKPNLNFGLRERRVHNA